jgi:hypothetical protein
MRSWWVVSEDGTYGCVSAETYEKADGMLFLGICQNRYPIDAILIETLPPEEQEVEDQDIISIEEVGS